MRTLSLCLCLTVAGLALPAAAEIGVLDPVPAATLLLPHFEVDLSNTLTGVNTLVTISNARAEPVIAHITLWSDLSVPTLNWNAYLTGYDVMTLDLRTLFVLGQVPQTEHLNDPDAVSPVGIFSLVTNPATGVGPGSSSCTGQLPLGPLPSSYLAHIRAAHTGQPSFLVGGLCLGVDHGDSIARGYITIDSTNLCGLGLPDDSGYFVDGGLGEANNLNALLGESVRIDAAEGTATGDTLVHLEADAALGAGSYTFYRRYSGGADNREPLGTAFWARYLDGGAFANGTHLTYWRDSKRAVNAFSCALTAPAPYPLGQTQLVAFDEQENPSELEVISPLPWESGRVEVGGGDLPVPFTFGWMFLNLNAAVAGSAVPFEPTMQNYLAVSFTAAGQFSYGFDAFRLDSALAPISTTLPICNGAPDPPACP